MGTDRPGGRGWLALSAPAKVNLHLRALARRPDGYTEIATLFQSIDLADRVKVRRRSSGGVEVTCDDPAVPAGPANLAHRAAELYLRETGLPGGVEVSVAKRIPLAAGLGGGSSDAAAVLRGLDRLSGEPLGAGALAGLAAKLGADVPFFLTGGTAVGRGRGEVLEPLPDAPSHPMVLVWPGEGVATSEAYRLLPPALTGSAAELTIILSSLARGDLGALAGLLANDLEAGVLAAHPPVRRAREALAESGAAVSLMTGSGSCCFGLYRGADEADRAARVLASGTGWRVFRVTFACREEHWGVVKR